MLASAEDLLWWQIPADHRRTIWPLYGPIFGPFPTAQVNTMREIALRSSAPISGERCAAPHAAEDSPGCAPQLSASKCIAVDFDAQTHTTPSDPEDPHPVRIEHRVDGEANFRWRDEGMDEDFPPVDVDTLRVLWKRYIAVDGDSAGQAACGGTTLMCHDLLNKFTVEPDLLQLFEKVGLLDDVVYVYLPLTYLKSSPTYKLKRPSRNKGYGFVHFSSNDAATRFAQLIRQVDLVGTGRGVKQMYTTLAKFQGVGANLVELLDLDNEEWRPKQGCFYVRLEPGGPLSCLGISPVRSFVLGAQKQFAN